MTCFYINSGSSKPWESERFVFECLRILQPIVTISNVAHEGNEKRAENEKQSPKLEQVLLSGSPSSQDAKQKKTLQTVREASRRESDVNLALIVSKGADCL